MATITTPSNYYMLNQQCSIVDDHERTDDQILLPGDFAQRARPGDGILLANWDDLEKIGLVTDLCVLLAICQGGRLGTVAREPVDIQLKPSPSGRRWWKNEFFKFAESVRERYMLDDLFAEQFPDYGNLELDKRSVSRAGIGRTYQKVAGYIYLLKSDYGYKIGKTVNLKDRTRLFEVKLPFKFDLEYSEYVQDYSRVEADLHRQYGQQRLEGEWFNLSDTDVAEIRSSLNSKATAS